MVKAPQISTAMKLRSIKISNNPPFNFNSLYFMFSNDSKTNCDATLEKLNIQLFTEGKKVGKVIRGKTNHSPIFPRRGQPENKPQ